jgi:hypothetical protein
MGTHIVIDGQIAKEELVADQKYTLNYLRLIHTAIFRALMLCPRVRMDVWDRFGRAPMHYAAQYGRFDFFDIAKGVRGEIDLDIRTQPQQMTCLQIAAQHGRSLLIMHLKDPKLDKNSVDTTDRTALHYACVMEHAEVISLLLNDSRVELNTCDVFLGFTKSLFATLGFLFGSWSSFICFRSPLMDSATNGRMTCVRALGMNDRVNLNQRDRVAF